ncbi:MAG: hypothetical protein V2A77_09055 [Pseudomonadota bacterium]
MFGVAIALMALGFLFALGLFYFLLVRRLRADVSGKQLVLKLPLLGEIETGFRLNAEQGLRIREARHVFEQAERIDRLVDLDLVLDYARRYDVSYVGFEGDMPDGSWTSGRLAYSTIHGSVCLNPNLDLPAMARELSDQLRRPLLPEDVYPFLFFHEVGHSTRAGNQCYITAQVNYSLSGGRRTAKRRRELQRLHSRIERFADEFAWKELVKCRARLAGTSRPCNTLLTHWVPPANENSEAPVAQLG